MLLVPLYRWRNWGSERLSYLLRLKQLIRGSTRIWTQANWLHRPCFSTARSCLQRKVTKRKCSTSLNKRPRKPGVRKMKSSFNNQKILNTYSVSGSVSSEPRGSRGNIPQRGHPEQESPMGPPLQPRSVTSMVTETVRGERNLCQLQRTEVRISRAFLGGGPKGQGPRAGSPFSYICLSSSWESVCGRSIWVTGPK